MTISGGRSRARLSARRGAWGVRDHQARHQVHEHGGDAQGLGEPGGEDHGADGGEHQALAVVLAADVEGEEQTDAEADPGRDDEPLEHRKVVAPDPVGPGAHAGE